MKTHRPLHIHPDSSIIFLTSRNYSGISWLYTNYIKQYFLEKLKEILPRYSIEVDAWVICNNHYHLLLSVPDGKQVPRFIKHLHGSTAHYIKQHLPQIVNGEQIITREITAWDRRQTARFNKEAELLELRLNSATTEQEKDNVLTQFIAHHKRNQNSSSTMYKVLANFKFAQKRELKFATTDPKVLVLLAAKDAPIWYQYVDYVIRNEEDYFKHLNYIHQNPVKHGYTKRITLYRWSSIHKWIEEKGREYVIDLFRQYPIIDFEPIFE